MHILVEIFMWEPASCVFSSYICLNRSYGLQVDSDISKYGFEKRKVNAATSA